MVRNGAFAAGERLPSVRALSKQHGVSISTVLQALRRLEDQGLLVARPQSGYYVASVPNATSALPSTPRVRPKPSTVSISGAISVLLEHASNSAFVPLGCAVPDAALLQSHRLDLALARAARQYGAQMNVYGALHGQECLRQELSKRM